MPPRTISILATGATMLPKTAATCALCVIHKGEPSVTTKGGVLLTDGPTVTAAMGGFTSAAVGSVG